MEIDAETLFNALGKRYEDAYIDSPELLAIIQYTLSKLPPHSHVLDVGCGTGRPVAAILASAGHAVYGIDVAETMVKIAASQVAGTFTKADMRKYTPPGRMDAIFAIYSLFQLCPSEVWMMIYRFASWLKDGGFIVLGVAPSSSPAAANGTYDPVWDCVRTRQTWMERPVYELYFSTEAWKSLLQGAGFIIETERMFDFVPRDSKHTRSETHYLIVARKVFSEPLMGPYPMPGVYALKSRPDIYAWVLLKERLAVHENEQMRFATLLQENARVLDIGGITSLMGRFIAPSESVTKLISPSPQLPYLDNQFDAVVATMVLDHVHDIPEFVRELMRVTKSSAEKSRIMLIQAAPDNEVLKMLYSVSSVSADIPGPNHQGLLLQSARRILSTNGFENISFHRFNTSYSFVEEYPSDRPNIADFLLESWFAGDSQYERMKEQLAGPLEGLLRDHPHSIWNGLMIMEAKRDPH